jgi:exopolyphosphatase/pppGpp-phosphohydrolase
MSKINLYIKSEGYMSRAYINQTIAETIKQAYQCLDERIDIVNFLTKAEFDFVNMGVRLGAFTEIHNGVSIKFNNGQITVEGKEEKFQEIDSRIQILLNRVHALCDSPPEAFKEILEELQYSTANHESEARELQAKIDETEHALSLSYRQYEAVHQAKEQSLQGLSPEQVALAIGTLACNAESSSIIGDSSASASQDSGIVGVD